MISKILCKLGIHKWSKPKLYLVASSNVEDWSKHCERCGKVKKWNKTRESLV